MQGRTLEQFKTGAPLGYNQPSNIHSRLIREQMIKLFKPRAKKLFMALYDAAIGLSVEELDDDGEVVRVYSKAPDVNAAKLLFEQTIGKPKEQIEHTGGLSVFHLVAELENQNGNDS